MSFQKTKLDPALGLKVHEHLKSLNIETPATQTTQTPSQKIDALQWHFESIHKSLGLDLTDDSLRDTPSRLAKMWVLEKFWGLDPDNFPKCTVVDNKFHYDEMVCEKGIKVMSVCEHHWETIHGSAAVAYIPKGKVLGLSKLNRIVDYFSHRPQVQERLTQQIGEALRFILATDDVAVSITAKHYCVISRGIEDQNSVTSTSYISGAFKNPTTRAEFYNLIK
jgi:GTP cyclohydrolase I